MADLRSLGHRVLIAAGPRLLNRAHRALIGAGLFHERVIRTADGDEVLRLLVRPVVDILIADCELAHHDAFGMATFIWSSPRHLPVIFLSEEDRLEFRTAAA